MRVGLTHSLHRLIQQKPDEVACIFEDRSISWGQLGDRVSRLAGALQQVGVRQGDRVGILALNSDRYLECMLAVWWAGACLNPVNIRWSASEIVYSLDDCETQILVVGDNVLQSAETLHEIRKKSSSLKTVVQIGGTALDSGVLSYEDIITAAQPVEDARREGGELAGVFYTGGTTGFPKGVMLSHDNLLSNALGYLLDLPYGEDEVILAAAPIFHQAGMCIVLRALVRGCCCVVIETFDPTAIMQAVERCKATFTLLVPTMVQRLVDHPDITSHDMRSLQKVLYGASPISAGLLERAFVALPNVEFFQGYGMTETGGPYTVLPPYFHTQEGRRAGRLRSAGKAAWGMEIMVVDVDSQPVATGVLGEVVARGPGIMQGYWGRPQETAAVLRDGWMYSGDVGYLDERGYLYIVDRTKDMIVSGGENVYSTEVENVVSKHPAVESCAVIGIPSEKWGEAVHAVIVCKAGQTLDERELREFCKESIAGYKCPASVEFRDALPMSGAAKVLKHVLRESYWKGRERRIG